MFASLQMLQPPSPEGFYYNRHYYEEEDEYDYHFGCSADYSLEGATAAAATHIEKQQQQQERLQAVQTTAQVYDALLRDMDLLLQNSRSPSLLKAVDDADQSLVKTSTTVVEASEEEPEEEPEEEEEEVSESLEEQEVEEVEKEEDEDEVENEEEDEEEEEDTTWMIQQELDLVPVDSYGTSFRSLRHPQMQLRLQQYQYDADEALTVEDVRSYYYNKESTITFDNINNNRNNNKSREPWHEKCWNFVQGIFTPYDAYTEELESLFLGMDGKTFYSLAPR